MVEVEFDSLPCVDEMIAVDHRVDYSLPHEGRPFGGYPPTAVISNMGHKAFG